MSAPSNFSKLIKKSFDDAWDEFGDDKSTEFLIAITADRMSVDYERVVDALAEMSQTKLAE